MAKLYCSISIILVTVYPCLSQKIKNPSFEGDIGINLLPEDWEPCDILSTPDTQPGLWNVDLAASNGVSYIGMVTRGDLGPQANTTEDIQTALSEPIIPGEEFTFNLDLAQSSTMGHVFGFEETFISYQNPVILKIYGSTEPCQQDQLLWESDTISHYDWKTYTVSFISETSLNYLIFKVDYSSDSTTFGNILIDNISECRFDIDWSEGLVICESEPITLNVAIPNGTYLWQDGSTDSVFFVEEAGIYNVRVSNGCYSEFFEVSVQTRNCFCDFPITVTPFDSLKCDNSEIILDAGTANGSYLWNTGSTSRSISVKEPGLYTVEVDNRCVSETFQYRIENVDCSCDISVPNVFTPNGDKINDLFEISLSPAVEAFLLKIYNREGLKLFESTTQEDFWDGKSNGKNVTPGVYYYSIDITCDQLAAKSRNTYKGWVQLIR